MIYHVSIDFQLMIRQNIYIYEAELKKLLSNINKNIEKEKNKD